MIDFNSSDQQSILKKGKLKATPVMIYLIITLLICFLDLTIAYSNETTISKFHEHDNISTTIITKVPPTFIVDCDQVVTVGDIDNGSTSNCQFVTGISTTGNIGAGGTIANPITEINFINGVDYDLSLSCPSLDNVFLHLIDQCSNETISSAVILSFTASNTLSFPPYADITESVVSTDCSQTISIPKPIVSGGCGGPISSIISVPMGVIVNDVGSAWVINFSAGITSITVMALDNCGNSTPPDTFNITVIDDIPPIPNNCPGAQTVNASSMCSADVTWINPTPSDNCDVSNLEISFSEHISSIRCTSNPMITPSDLSTVVGGATLSATFETGVTEILFSVTDVNGLTGTCNTLITVNDVTNPTILTAALDQSLMTNSSADCPFLGIPLRSNGNNIDDGNPIPFGMPFTVAGQAFTAPVAVDFSDNCSITPQGEISAFIIEDSTNDACTSSYTIEWTMTDCGGNSVTDDQVFIITDDTAPSLSGTLPSPTPINDCKPSQTTAEGYFDIVAVKAAYSDACGSISVQDIASTIDPLSDNCNWIVTHTFNINDGCDNITAGSYMTTGADITAPTGMYNLADAGPINACLSEAISATEAIISKASEIAIIEVDYTDSCGTSVTATLENEYITGATMATDTFEYTGDMQTWTVPAGVTSVTLEAIGAQGGAGNAGGYDPGGLGGYASGTLVVTPGQVLNIFVGGQPTDDNGGFNGGGNARSNLPNLLRGAGGGSSDVRVGGISFNDRIIVGGGGGGSCGLAGKGGVGGGLIGGNIFSGTDGKGGTQTSGGAGGAPGFGCDPGSFGIGGDNTSSAFCPGGGGGWYGGGSGCGAGGGSSYIDGVSGGTTMSGTNSGNGLVRIIYSISAPSTDCSWSVVRSYRVEDACGNEAAAPIIVTHTGGDKTAPIGTINLMNIGPINDCLIDAISATEIASPIAAEISMLESDYTDNCGTPVIAKITNEHIDSGSTDCNWSVTRTYSVEDACGNFAVGLITVTHTGGITTGPTIITPQPDQNLNTITSACNQDVFIQKSATINNCGGGSAVLSITADDLNINFGGLSPLSTEWNAAFPLGVTTVTITATDSCGNTTDDTVIITISDNTPPTLIGNCPSDVTLNTVIGTCAVSHTWNNPGFIDNCFLDELDITFTSDIVDTVTGPLPVDRSYAFPQSQGGQSETELFSEGTSKVTYVLSDVSSNNTELCTFNITVIDNETPIAICQDVTVILDATGNASIAVTDIDNGSIDNCALGLSSLSESTFSCADVGDNIVTLSVSQLHTPLLTGTCNATVIVSDQENPVPICPSIPDVLLDVMGSGTLPADAAAGGLSVDNCGINLVESSPEVTFTCVELGPQSVTLTVTDGTNTATTACGYNVVDNLAPNAVCQDVTIVLDANGNTGITAAAVNNGSTDNCGITSMELSQTSFDCTEVGTNTINLALSDGVNASSCTAMIHVEDNEAPIAVCPTVMPSVTITTSNGAVTLPSDALAGGNSTDNCGVNLVETSPVVTFDCNDVLVNRLVTLTASDGTNISTVDCLIHIISGGALAWTSALPEDQSLNALVTGCSQTVFIPIPTSIGSSCSGTIVTEISAPGNINFGNLGTLWRGNFPLGVTPVTITATDELGVLLTHTLTVTIIDDTPPEFTTGCPVNIIIPPSDPCEPVASFNIPNVFDACGVAAVDINYSGLPIIPPARSSLATGTMITEFYNQGITMVTLTATDINGLLSTCAFTIESPCSNNSNPCVNDRYISTADIVANGISSLHKSNIRTYSDALITSGYNIDYFGGTEVELLPGFETIIGADFLADIAPCNSLPITGPIAPESKKLSHSTIKELKETKDIIIDQNIEIRK